MSFDVMDVVKPELEEETSNDRWIFVPTDEFWSPILPPRLGVIDGSVVKAIWEKPHKLLFVKNGYLYGVRITPPGQDTYLLSAHRPTVVWRSSSLTVTADLFLFGY